MATVFQLLDPAHGVLRTAPERADVQQRARVAAASLSEALGRAGAGPAYGPAAGSLAEQIAPVLPFRIGRRNPDPEGTARPDALTVLSVPAGARQTTLAVPLKAQSGQAIVDLAPNCPQGDPSCGFEPGVDVLVIGAHGRFALFSIIAVQGTTLSLQHNTRDSSYVFPAGAALVEASSRTFSLRADVTTNQTQLVRYAGDGGGDVPVVDHVVGLSFRYYGVGQPPAVIKPPESTEGPWSTYGPRPPLATDQPTLHPVGENCAFQLDVATAAAVPRLASLGSGDRVELPIAQLQDGPWCPDSSDPNRFDADLLRIRRIAATVRVEATSASQRGAAGPLFSRIGTAARADRWVADLEQTIEIAPASLEPGR
jgi:hypothetical protein